MNESHDPKNRAKQKASGAWRPSVCPSNMAALLAAPGRAEVAWRRLTCGPGRPGDHGGAEEEAEEEEEDVWDGAGRRGASRPGPPPAPPRLAGTRHVHEHTRRTSLRPGSTLRRARRQKGPLEGKYDPHFRRKGPVKKGPATSGGEGGGVA